VYVGPIRNLLGTSGSGYDPVKSLKITSTTSSTQGGGAGQVVLFDATYPYSLQADSKQHNLQHVILEATQTLALVRMHQFEELFMNSEWQRAGVFLTFREDGTLDGEDGWYTLDSLDVDESMIFSAYAEPKLDVSCRRHQQETIGVYVDAKAVPNDLSLSGTTLAVQPGGTTQGYPLNTWSFAASDGSTILANENPPTTMQMPFTSPTNCMTQQRCTVLVDNGSTIHSEVFWRDHRWVNRYTIIHNGLLRYTYDATSNGHPLIECWTGAAWTTIGNYQLQAYDGTTYTPLPAQTIQLRIVSPEEIVWDETRYDITGIAMVRVTNRIRRGSRLIESQVVTASGLGLTGAQSVALTATGATAAALTADSSGSLATGASGVVPIPGFTYLSPVPTAVTFSSTNFYSGIKVAAGTVARFNIVSAYRDAMRTTLTTDALLIQRWAAYSRTRVKQRILI
jgi:hypothetical protein